MHLDQQLTTTFSISAKPFLQFQIVKDTISQLLVFRHFAIGRHGQIDRFVGKSSHNNLYSRSQRDLSCTRRVEGLSHEKKKTNDLHPAHACSVWRSANEILDEGSHEKVRRRKIVRWRFSFVYRTTTSPYLLLFSIYIIIVSVRIERIFFLHILFSPLARRMPSMLFFDKARLMTREQGFYFWNICVYANSQFVAFEYL